MWQGSEKSTQETGTHLTLVCFSNLVGMIICKGDWKDHKDTVDWEHLVSCAMVQWSIYAIHHSEVILLALDAIFLSRNLNGMSIGTFML